jgi:hypothetical protein
MRLKKDRMILTVQAIRSSTGDMAYYCPVCGSMVRADSTMVESLRTKGFISHNGYAPIEGYIDTCEVQHDKYFFVYWER